MEAQMQVRKTRTEDLETIDRLYRQAKLFMHENGNPTQWAGEYPNREDAAADMHNGTGYVCEKDGTVRAVFCCKPGDDPTYGYIKGKWLNDRPYCAVHRIAAGGRSGAAAFALQWCLQQYANVKIDTHRDNLPMRSLLRKDGFSYCGIIYLENGEERMAFQKSLE